MSPNSEPVQEYLVQHQNPAVDILQDDRGELVRRLQEKSEGVEVHNFDPNDPESTVALMVMEMTESKSIHALAPCTVNVVYVHLKQAEVTNQKTGEVEGKIRTTLIDNEGQVWTTNGPGVARVFLPLMRLSVARKAFSPPIQVSFQNVATGNAGKFLRATIDADLIRQLVRGV